MGRRRGISIPGGLSGGFGAMAMIAAIMGIIIAFSQGWLDALNLDLNIGANLISVLPGLFFCTVALMWMGLGALKDPWGSVGSCAVLGVGFAFLCQELYDVNVLTLDMLGGASIASLETLLIVAGVVIGGVFAAGKR